MDERRQVYFLLSAASFGGVTGRPEFKPEYWYFAFFSEGFKIWKKANDETTSIIINPTAKQAKVQSSFNENNARTLMARSTVTLFTFQLLENSYQLKQIYKNNTNALTKSAQ